MEFRFLCSGELPEAAPLFFDRYIADRDMNTNIDVDSVYDLLGEDDTQEYYIGAFDNGELVAMASIGGAEAYTSGKDAVLSDVYVLPSYRRNGVGSQLVFFALSEISKKWTDKVLITVLDNSLFSFYEKLGFVKEPNGDITGEMYFCISDLQKLSR